MSKKLRGWALMNTMLAIIGTIFLMAIASFKIPEMLNDAKEAKAAQLTATVGSLISQYKLEIGKYPDKLSDLTKADGQYGPWLKEVPKDPFAGKKDLQYKKSDKAYAVYSVGKNGSSNSDADKIGEDDIGFTGN